MAKLAKAVFVQGVLLLPGEEPEPRLAALVTNPDAWEDGKPPAAATSKSESASSEAADDKPAAKRAARKPARGRDAADEGDSGD